MHIGFAILNAQLIFGFISDTRKVDFNVVWLILCLAPNKTKIYIALKFAYYEEMLAFKCLRNSTL